MRKMEVVVLACFLLGIGVGFGGGQTKTGREQQVQAHAQKAGEYLQQNQPELAMQEFKAIVAIDPNNVDAQGNLGAVLFFQGSYQDAIPHLRAALKLRPKLWKTQALLGMAERRAGDVQAARSNLSKAFPNLPEKKIQIQTGMELVELESTSGDLEAAASTVAALRKLEPEDGSILYTAYRVYSDLADESLLSLSVVDPNSPHMHQALAHELAKRGDTARAIEDYRLALKADPQLPGIHFELAEMLRTLGTPESTREAEAEYETALAANPRDWQSERRLGDIALQRNDLAVASERYGRAIQLQPGDVDASIGLAKVYMAQNEPSKAQGLLERALQQDPTNAVAHYRLGTIYRQTGHSSEAKHELEEYQKYHKMKEKLRQVYRDLHRDQPQEEDDSSKQD